MYIGFIDDSGSGGAEDKQPFQVIGGPIIKDAVYPQIEFKLLQEVYRLVPEEEWDSFEFHAFDLYHANPPFGALGREKCWSLIENALRSLKEYKIPLIFGAVDREGLKKKFYRSADPADIAFDSYLESLEKWFGNLEKEFPLGLLICDDVRTHKAGATGRGEGDRRGDIRRVIERGFRRNRTRPKLMNISFQNELIPAAVHKNLSSLLFDDIYFGDSKNSMGIQLADIAVYSVARHLAGKPDSEGFYKIIEEQIVNLKVLPPV